MGETGSTVAGFAGAPVTEGTALRVVRAAAGWAGLEAAGWAADSAATGLAEAKIGETGSTVAGFAGVLRWGGRERKAERGEEYGAAMNDFEVYDLVGRMRGVGRRTTLLGIVE